MTVVNRVRAAAVGGGDPQAEIAAALSRYAGVTDVRFVPMDLDAYDAAIATGRTLVEVAPAHRPGWPCRRSPPVSAARLGRDGAVGAALRAPDAKQAALALGVLPELHPRDRAQVHVVRPVGDAQRARVRPHAREREVVGDAAAAVHLDGAVDDVEARRAARSP